MMAAPAYTTTSIVGNGPSAISEPDVQEGQIAPLYGLIWPRKA